MEYIYKDFTFTYKLIDDFDIEITKAKYNLKNNTSILDIPSFINGYCVRSLNCSCKFNINSIKYIKFPDGLYNQPSSHMLLFVFSNLQVIKSGNIWLYREEEGWKIL